MLLLVLLTFLETTFVWTNDPPPSNALSTFIYSRESCTHDVLYGRRVILDIQKSRSVILCTTECSLNNPCRAVIVQTFSDRPQSCTLLSDKDVVSGFTPDVSGSRTCRVLKMVKAMIPCKSWKEPDLLGCVCPKAIKGADVVYKKEDAVNKKYDMFLKTRIERGRFYLFGLHEIPNVDMAQEVCCWHGGYLAEIDDRKEKRFLQYFKIKRLGNWDFFWLGGSDKREEGTWEFPYTKHPWKYTSWFRGEPNNRRNNEHCQVFFSLAGQRMLLLDLACHKQRYPSSRSRSSSMRFICEIPV